MTSAEKLCLACGMCCDGTLFDNVRLGAGDAPARLKTLGLPVTRSRAQPPVTFFRQPCAALCGDGKCRVYSDRPAQCRAYECGVFQAHAAGRLSAPAALREVRRARRQADTIRRLLRALGDTDETRSLSDRFRRTLRRLETEGGDPGQQAIFARLGQAFHAFALLKHEKFYTREEAAGKQV